jgi:hypothetical protein
MALCKPEECLRNVVRFQKAQALQMQIFIAHAEIVAQTGSNENEYCMRNTTCNILLNSYAQWCTAVKDRDLLQAFPMLNMCNETPSEIVTVEIGLSFVDLLPFPVKDSFLPIARTTN